MLHKARMFLNVSVDLPKVSGFAALNTTESSTVLSWTQVTGVSGYLLTWRHISGQEREEQVLDRAVWMLWWEERGWLFQAIKGFFFLVLETKSQKLDPSFSSHKITNLLHGRTYIFTIRPLYGDVEGPISTVYQKIGKGLEEWFESWELFFRFPVSIFSQGYLETFVTSFLCPRGTGSSDGDSPFCANHCGPPCHSRCRQDHWAY